ncbi:hypothetical protein [Kitasatospora phosalacinea]|uniref:hypothetical protein n=1 Tax=Kitasatospora phosalacinea TaxID=2065 RepID=UPI001F38F756|nr:hypothetical protein [Kitasatospora phosalacinea]
MTAVDGLPPLGTELGRERLEFAEELRALFRRLDTPADEFATRCGLGPDALAGYLAAGRIPPWEFVEALLVAVHGDAPGAPDPAVRERLSRARMAALRVARSIGRAVCQLEGQLHSAAREIEQADEQADRADRALAALAALAGSTGDTGDTGDTGSVERAERAEQLAEQSDRAREQSDRARVRSDCCSANSPWWSSSRTPPRPRRPPPGRSPATARRPRSCWWTTVRRT